MIYMRSGSVWHILRAMNPSRAWCGKSWRFDDDETEEKPDKKMICKVCEQAARRAGLKVK